MGALESTSTSAEAEPHDIIRMTIPARYHDAMGAFHQRLIRLAQTGDFWRYKRVAVSGERRQVIVSCTAPIDWIGRAGGRHGPSGGHYEPCWWFTEEPRTPGAVPAGWPQPMVWRTNSSGCSKCASRLAKHADVAMWLTAGRMAPSIWSGSRVWPISLAPHWCFVCGGTITQGRWCCLKSSCQKTVRAFVHGAYCWWVLLGLAYGQETARLAGSRLAQLTRWPCVTRLSLV